MEYRAGSIGRVFAARIDHDEDVIAELIKLARLEHIRQAFFVLIGAIKHAHFVTGPKETTVPPDPMWSSLDDAHEILGIGNIFRKGDEPGVHLHAALGREGSTLVVCLREKIAAYLTVEVFILEMTDVSVKRAYDDSFGIKRMMMQ